MRGDAVAQSDPFLQVLLFRNTRQSDELGPSLWAALQEVEQFYNRALPPRTYHRFYLAESVPDEVKRALPLDWEHVGAAVKDEGFWSNLRGRYQRTYDPNRLAEKVRHLLMEQASQRPDLSERLNVGQPRGAEGRSPLDLLRDAPLLLVMDQELTPPPDWRYIIYDNCRAGVVVSIAPIDPHYWHEPPENRVASIKHRVRAACCSALGGLLGLERCDNPSCMLFESVESVSNLDRMILLGPEHGISLLADRGFEARPSDPTQVQPIIPLVPAR
jgi:hypothetical protein